MHAGKHYGLWEIVTWTKRDTLVFLLVGALPVLLESLGLPAAVVPWAPVAVLGTAVAFMTGFKSNAAYGRLWEARQIWGAIVNASRTWSLMVRDLPTAADHTNDVRRLLLRHVAWLTALRHQLREPRVWESQAAPHNVEYRSGTFAVPEHGEPLEDALRALIGDEASAVLSKKNRASAVLAMQSADLRRARQEGRLSEFSHVEFLRTLSLLVEQQGKCERIKNFPYPRQFATLNLFFVWLFVLILPFGIAAELKRVAPAFLWLTVPMTWLVAWVFHTMDKIGEASENPFEGGPNDVPISAMSRAIEIDLREMLGETDLPKPLSPTANILM